MLCPQCGSSVGDTLTLCVKCQKRGEELAATSDTGKESAEMTVKSPHPPLRGAHEDPVLDVVSFFTSPAGILLSSLVLFIVFWLVIAVALPYKGLFELFHIALFFFGAAISIVGRYAYFLDREKRGLGVLIGVVLIGLSALSYSAFSDKGFWDTYDDFIDDIGKM